MDTSEPPPWLAQCRTEEWVDPSERFVDEHGRGWEPWFLAYCEARRRWRAAREKWLGEHPDHPLAGRFGPAPGVGRDLSSRRVRSSGHGEHVPGGPA